MPVYNEIKAQYSALNRTVIASRDAVPHIRQIMESRRGARIVFLGCGSSYTLAKSFAVAVNQRTKQYTALALAGGELLLRTEEYAHYVDGSILVAVSRSGSTSELVKSFEKLKQLNLPYTLLSLSCVADAPLNAVSDYVVGLPWAFDESVCQTRTVTNLYAAGMYIIGALTGDTQLVKDLELSVQYGQGFMEQAEPVMRSLAEKHWTNVCVLGDAELGGLLEEGALAFKEICRVPSNYYHVLDVRHGPMVLLGRDTLVIIAVDDPESRLEQDLIQDVLAKGCTTLLYSDTGIHTAGAVSINSGNALSRAARGIPLILLCQLISYYKALHLHVDPDKPEGLDAWISL